MEEKLVSIISFFSVPKSENLENNVQILHSEEVVIEEPEPVPNIAEVEWTGEVFPTPLYYAPYNAINVFIFRSDPTRILSSKTISQLL